MSCSLTLEVVPDALAGASHCGPLVRPAFRDALAAIPRSRSRSWNTAALASEVVSTERSPEPTDHGLEGRSRQTSDPPPAADHGSSVGAAVDIVVPVYNEERVLEENVRRLHAYLHAWFPLPTRITIADNASTDGTWQVATSLALELPNVRAIHLDQKGRGRALRAAWGLSDAAVVAYMDVDLSTGLSALLPLVAPLLSGHSDVAIGSRLGRGARVVRGPRREVISRCYNLLLKMVLRVGFSDAQCGFKAVRADRVRELLPEIQDNEWFFDTELLVMAERAGLRIHEVPVDWVDDADSRVDIVSTAAADLKGVLRLLVVGWIPGPVAERAHRVESKPPRPHRSSRPGGPAAAGPKGGELR